MAESFKGEATHPSRTAPGRHEQDPGRVSVTGAKRAGHAPSNRCPWPADMTRPDGAVPLPDGGGRGGGHCGLPGRETRLTMGWEQSS